MGHTEDLEEFDAELEIALKREYATVFPLFRFCVITQEATYLCNKLAMDCVPHATYLLFEIQMEDVWVWDRNRPTRIIPRAQVYTTSDVTVEQLKEDGADDFAASIPQNVVEQLRASLESDDSGEEEPEEELAEDGGEETVGGGGEDSSADE